jgi:sugar phosphate isomerase/epimerase
MALSQQSMAGMNMTNKLYAINRRTFLQSASASPAILAAAAGAKTVLAAPAAEIKVGLYSITYGGVWYRGEALTTEQVVERARKFGYDGVEIDGKRPHGNPLDMPKVRCQKLKKLAADRGIEIYAVSGNNDFSSPIPEHRESQMVYLRELLRMTSDLGAKIVRVFLGWPGVTLKPEGGGRYDLAKAVWQAEHKDFSEEQTWGWCRQGMIEAAKLAGDFGITLALQNHAPVINRGYLDVIKMVEEVNSANLKICFDARLEHSLSDVEVRQALNRIGTRQVLWHYGGEYDKGPQGIVLKGDEKALAEVLGLLDIGYKGWAGFELCHPLPEVDGKTVGIDFVDKNAQLALEYMRGIIAEGRKKHAARG